MVVLAASICTRGGKAILSRQFCDMTRDRVTALLASFPKLAQAGSQHTVVDSESVRYVYQPIEELYVILITDKQSNILQDISTLRLLSQIVSSMVRTLDEREIMANAFEILSAFDEVIALGYRENLSLSQVKTFLEMESHEEKIQEIIERNKELEAAEERKRKAKQLEMQRREMQRRGPQSGLAASHYGGFGSSSTGPSSPLGVNNGSVAASSFAGSAKLDKKSAYDYNGGVSATKPAFKTKGLQLGSKKGTGLNALKSEAETAPLMEDLGGYTAGASSNFAGATAPSATAVAVHSNISSAGQGIEISVLEQISASLGRDGSVNNAEIKGNLNLRISDPNMRNVRLITAAEGPYQYKTHPNVNRNEFVQNKTIAVKDPSRPFPANGQEIGVLRWKISGAGVADQLPLTFNCWFSPSDPGFIDVTIEYELNSEFTEPLSNVVVIIPLVSSNAHVADPSMLFDQADDHLEWMIPDIEPGSSNTTGSFSFTAEADQEDDFFPMRVQFRSKDSLTSIGQVDVQDVVSSTDESESMPFTKKILLVSDQYLIE